MIDLDNASSYNRRAAKHIPLAEIDSGRAVAVGPNFAKGYVSGAELSVARKNYNQACADVRKAQDLGGRVSSVFLEALRKNAPGV